MFTNKSRLKRELLAAFEEFHKGLEKEQPLSSMRVDRALDRFLDVLAREVEAMRK